MRIPCKARGALKPGLAGPYFPRKKDEHIQIIYIGERQHPGDTPVVFHKKEAGLMMKKVMEAEAELPQVGQILRSEKALPQLLTLMQAGDKANVHGFVRCLVWMPRVLDSNAVPPPGD